jgi:hypothetical protein
MLRLSVQSSRHDRQTTYLEQRCRRFSPLEPAHKVSETGVRLVWLHKPLDHLCESLEIDCFIPMVLQ